MMVVLLIITIVLAAMAPIVTTRMKHSDGGAVNGDSPWIWADGKVDAYFGDGDDQMAMIGQTARVGGLTPDPKAKLIINTNDSIDNHVLFKKGSDVLGSLRMVLGEKAGTYTGSVANAIFLGNDFTLHGTPNANIGIGFANNLAGDVSGDWHGGDYMQGGESIVLGSHNTVDTRATVIGFNSSAGQDDIVIGSGSSTPSSENGHWRYNAIVIGNNAQASVDGVAIGSGSSVSSEGVSIGANSKAGSYRSVAIYGSVYENSGNSIAISGSVYKNSEDSIAIGAGATGKKSIAIGGAASGEYSVAIGNNAHAKGAIVIGGGDLPYTNRPNSASAIAIGSFVRVGDNSSNSIAIGTSTDIGENCSNCIAIGYQAFVQDDSENGVAIGAGSRVYRKNEIALGTEEYTVNVDGTLKVKGSVVPSDRRLKYVGTENKSGLDKIRQMKIYNYTFKKDPSKEPRIGVIAQDLQKILPNAVKKASDGFLTIRPEDILYTLVNAVKELDIKVSEILKQVQNDKTEMNAKITEILKQVQNDRKQAQNDKKELHAKITKLEQKNRQLEQELGVLKARLEKLEKSTK